MEPSYTKLVEAIRAEAKPGIWSQGVQLSRGDSVALESKSGGEVVLRVRAPGRPVPWTVVLYPEDDAWECNCPGPMDPCMHVVGAALALQQGAAAGTLATTETRWSRVVYRFSRASGGLELRRTIISGEGVETPLETSLAVVLSDPSKKARLQVEQHDLNADRVLEKATRGPVRPERLRNLLEILEPSKTVLLDGQPVVLSREPLLPRAVVTDEGELLAVSLAKNPRMTELLAPGVALAGEQLQPLGETALTGEWLEKLPSTRRYELSQAGELTSNMLPELARRMPVEVKSARLPRVDKELRPRVLLELHQLPTGLSVLPLLVYGAPATVRIDAGRMVHLKGAVPVRDEPAEQRLLQQLREELGLLPGRRSTYSGADAVRMADQLRRWRGALTGEAAALVSPNVRLVPKLSVDSGVTELGVPRASFTLEFEVQGLKGEPASVGAEAVLRAWKEGLGLVPLAGGGWAPLPTAWLEKHSAQLESLLAARAEDGRVANHALPELGRLCEELEHPAPLGLSKLAPLVEGFEKLPPPELPEGLNATLRPYQLQGVAWLQFLQKAGLGGVLADDMGLGKTLQALCVLEKGALVVCPTSVLPNWAAELSRFRPGLKVCVYHGPNRELDAGAEVTLTSYAILRLDEAVLTAKAWSAVVLDEAQAVKNPDSQVAQAAYGLKAGFRLALSGTPIENRLEELWSVMHFANPGLLGGRREFAEKWARPVEEARAGAASELRRRIRPFVLRRLKKDVAPELPLKSESVLHVLLTEHERAVYDTVYSATRAEVVGLLEGGGSVLKALEALLRLRQAACHPALVPGQQAATSSKVRTLVETLQTAAADGHKALVFSQWTSLLDLIEPELRGAGLAFTRLDGSTVDRGAVTEEFNSPEGPPVMLISLKAGGTGLNLTAADHVFLVDPWWNPAVEAQAADRAHRIGQTRPVNVYRLVAQGTVEERILGLQEKKRELFEAALGEAAGATAISKTDLLELFSP